MTKLQKACCIIMSLCFWAVLAVMPGPFFMRGNAYRQFPLYCFLEKKARSVPEREDPETYEKLMEGNAAYLSKQMEKENRSLDIVAENQDRLLQEQEDTVSPAESTGKPETTAIPSSTKAPEITKVPENTKAPEITETPEITEAPEITKAPAISAVPEEAAAALAQIQPAPVIDLSPEILADYDYLLNHFFIVDESTATNAEQLNAENFLAKDLTIAKDSAYPQILIYHSHTQEAFVDSREGEITDTIVGVGDYLEKILTDTYGYQVIHITEPFDMAGGTLDRSAAYDYARPYIEQVLAENPSIEVVIDLHRDGVPEDRHLVTTINGKPTAQIMFYNGLSYTRSKGNVDYLPNPYIEDNLAFSFQMEYQAAQYYPDFYRGIYLSGLRYNLHLKKRAVLLEAGAQTNTVQEVKNAMEPFADILDRVLRGGR